MAVLHFTWLVNSAAHLFGMKPYDKTIGPSENRCSRRPLPSQSQLSPMLPSRLVSVLAMGEGFHNYHHTFPYDYSTSEWGFRLNVTTRSVPVPYKCSNTSTRLNVTTRFIDTMAWLGQAYDLR